MAQLLEPGTEEEPANGIDGHAPKPAQSHTTALIIPTSVTRTRMTMRSDTPDSLASLMSTRVPAL
jgi:hypothetical protein